MEKNNSADFLCVLEHDMASKYCVICEKCKSTIECRNCNMEICKKCDERLHSTGVRKFHDRTVIPYNNIIVAAEVTPDVYENEPLLHNLQQNCPAQWLRVSHGCIDENNYFTLATESDRRLYIGRTSINGALVPGVVDTSRKSCYVIYDGKLKRSCDFEILLYDVSLSWLPYDPVTSSLKKRTNVVFPQEAVLGGVTKEGNEFYIGRIKSENQKGSWELGRIEDQICYCAHLGVECKYASYEVLVYK